MLQLIRFFFFQGNPFFSLLFLNATFSKVRSLEIYLMISLTRLSTCKIWSKKQYLTQKFTTAEIFSLRLRIKDVYLFKRYVFD